MPGIDGFEVCKAIKDNPEKQQLPIIFLTAKTDTESIIKGFETGAVDYVSKPFNKNELLARVSTHLELKRSRDEIKRYARDIKNKNKLITSSIHYAQNIQNATLPSPESLKEILPEHFILYKPKDVVSGDFYWISQDKGKIIVVSADCTGHGVPGAFMSILGICLLNEIVKREKITKPSEILDNLRNKIIDSLQQHVKTNADDGMDAAILLIDLKNKTLEFAGANNPLYIIRNGQLSVVRPDRMPVSIFWKMKKFTNQKLKLLNGDMIYIFSDGYYDQFGGPDGRKFMMSVFQQLLLEIHQKSMEEQKLILDKTLEDWKGNLEQIDDILVIGIKP